MDVISFFERSSSVLHFDDGSMSTAGELAEHGRELATVMSAEGFERGDRVAVQLPNGSDYIRLLLACASAGFVAVSINTRYPAVEVEELISRSGAKRARHVTVAGIEAVGAVGDAVGDPDDPFVVFTTSGTTSKPKMVLHRQRSITAHASDVAAAFGYSPEDTVMVAMPLCGTFGLASLTGAIAGNATIVVTDFEIDRTAALIERHRITALNGSDDMFHRLIEHDTDLASIRLGGYARFNTSLDGVVESAERAGATLTGLYGMSEVQALFSLRDPSLDATGRARAGGTIVSPAADFRVVDDELQLRGPSMMAGYLVEGGDRIDEVLTGRHLDDGWFRTGDLAAVDGPRTFDYRTRIGDAMRLGGFLVSPSEVEGVITQRSDVVAAQVVAVDRPGGARPVAFIIGDASERDVIEWCRGRLAIYKVPIRVVTVDTFPSTAGANGTKIQRSKLRERAEAMLADGR